MGIYLNPTNESFTKDRNYKIYVDKTGLLKFLNESISTPKNCIAVSHARRFGKSHVAGMIDAYYSLGCDSTKLFEGTEISESADFKKYMNKYNVIHLDISSVWDFHKEDLIESIKKRVCDDFKEDFGEKLDYDKDLYLLIYEIYCKTEIPFVIIIDEWDCVIRSSKDKEIVHRYLRFLHSLFKSEESKTFLALAYITGILPIKKIKDESALDSFREYTMLKSKPITKYYGFTEDEVKVLCEQFNMDFDSYWRNTSSFASINTFITMNYVGLKDDIMTMLSGGSVRVNPNTFKNDFSEIASKDDALTALIHLGYLGYDIDRKRAFVPNYEVATAFELALSGYSDKILLVGISYDAEGKEKKHHNCVIEEV